MASIFNAIIKRFAGPYQKLVAKRLRLYGLKYDDVVIESPTMLKALSRTSAVARKEREMRIVRAFDLSAKRKTLPAEVAATYNPFDRYLQKNLILAEEEKAEKVLLRE